MRNSSQGLVGTNNFGQSNGGRRTANRRGAAGGNQAGFNGMNSFGQQNFNNGNFNPNANAGGQSRRAIQPQHRVAFPFVPRTSGATSAKLERILAPHPKAKIQIRNLRIETADAGVITLHGEVPSEHQKELAGMMAKFEPGVREVHNELTVHTPEAPSTTPAVQ